LFINHIIFLEMQYNTQILDALNSMNTHTQSTSINTSERLSRLDLKIHKVDHQEYLAVNENIASH
jgi:hypothetical protein